MAGQNGSSRSARSELFLAVGVGGNGGDEAAEDEFAEEVAGDISADADAERLEGVIDTAAGLRVVEVGDGAGGEAAEQVRVVELALAVDAAGDEDGLERVVGAGTEAA